MLTVFSGYAQEVKLKGKIKLDALEAPIHIINVNSKMVTLTSSEGDFDIMVKEGDVIVISSVQYENRSIKVTPQILSKPFLEVELAQDINQLDEVRIVNLSGNLKRDLEKIKVVENPFFHMEIGPAAQNSGVTNDAMESTKIGGGAGSVNILGLAGMILGNKNLGNLSPASNAPERFTAKKANYILRKRFDVEFFKRHLKIEEPYIADFIDYSFENGLTEALLEDEKGLELIKFLEYQSKKFLHAVIERS